jgi:hypothetical protein
MPCIEPEATGATGYGVTDRRPACSHFNSIRLPQQARQLADIRRNPPRLVFAQQLDCRAAAWFVPRLRKRAGSDPTRSGFSI